MLLDLVRRADAPLVEQILAPLWKNLEADYVRQFLVDNTSVRFVCSHRACPVDKSIDTPKGTTIGQAKEAFKMGFFTAGGTALVPFVDGQRVDDTYCLQGGEVVEFKMP